MEVEKNIGSRDPEQPRFDIARSFISVSGLPQERWENVFKVAYARACYIVRQTENNDEIEDYPGEFPGIVDVATESILLEMTAEN